MNRKHLTIAVAALALGYSQAAFTQDPVTQKQIETAAAKATAEAKGETSAPVAPASNTVVVEQVPVAVATPSPESASATAEVEALKAIFLERKRANYKRVELDFAKEKAFNKNSELLQKQTEDLYNSAVQNLNSAVGSVSEPQAQETYFEYDMDQESGEFIIIQIRDSYVKAERGDVCQVSTRVHLITSLEKELSTVIGTAAEVAPVPAPAEGTPAAPVSDAAVTVDPAAPVTESYTEIKCYNDKRTSYHQLVIK